MKAKKKETDEKYIEKKKEARKRQKHKEKQISADKQITTRYITIVIIKYDDTINKCSIFISNCFPTK